MATFSYSILGQIFPTDGSENILYVVPVNTQTITSTLMICNQTPNPQQFKVAVRRNGESLESKHYIYYDAPIDGTDTLDLTTALTLSAGDIISVICDPNTLSFNLSGTEYL